MRKTKAIKLPSRQATYQELARFFDQHDAADLLAQGITEIDLDREDLDEMLLERRRHEDD